MLRYGWFFQILITITTHAEAVEYINIDINGDVVCTLEMKTIRPPIFSCNKKDYDDVKFNSSHSWYIKDDITCVAAIENIKTVAKLCRKRWNRVHWKVVGTPSIHGTNIRGEPLEAGNVFGSNDSKPIQSKE